MCNPMFNKKWDYFLMYLRRDKRLIKLLFIKFAKYI